MPASAADAFAALFTDAEPLVCLPWRYEDRELLLDAWRVSSWRGEPRSLEAQPLQWMLPASVDPMILAPADRVILAALG